MGRNCGYLALMSGLATGADWVLIPESPPDVDNWQEKMCERLHAGRDAGRRRQDHGDRGRGSRSKREADTGDEVAKMLEERLSEEVRVTVLGHVQRGGAPSAFDRNLGTFLGHAAVETLIVVKPGDEPSADWNAWKPHRALALMECVERTQAVARRWAHRLREGDEPARRQFQRKLPTLRTLVRGLAAPARGGPTPVAPGGDEFGVAGAGDDAAASGPRCASASTRVM